ncbi:ABC transporter ATP-binding protein [Agrococcus casei]|uniref:ABC transporter ATP-binding protein n=2 Tax=Agrococcus TaxID=46352 RepID=A0A1R4GF55_9MICO|nr:ABC transporter ATP-binding protein [Agrococcus casei]SJM66675.1 ABC transporter ATP-binding protein [Agrococcus casei LMG 22410]
MAFGRRQKDEGPRASLKELLPYLFVRRGLFAGAIVLSLIGAVTSLIQPLFVQEIIARVEQQSPLAWLPLLLVVFVLADALVSGFEHFLLQVIGENVVRGSRRRLVSRMLHLPIIEFDARRTGDLVSRVGSDTTLLRAVLTQGLVEAIGGTLTLVGAVIAMAIIDPMLLGVTVGVVAIAIVAMVVVMPLLSRATRRAQEQVGHLTSALERGISGIRTIRAAGASEQEISEIHSRTDDAYRAGIKVAQISAFVVPVAGLAMQLAFLAVLGLGGLRVASGDLAIAQLVAFLMFLFLMIMPLGQLFGAMSAVSQALGALGRIQEIVRLPSEAEVPAAAAQPSRQTDAAIEFVDVSFAYPEQVVHAKSTTSDEAAAEGAVSPKSVLRNVSFRVPRGSKIALVGPSGAGKSTSFALIERFYEPDTGSIHVDGGDVRSLSHEELRSRIGYVEQDARVLAGTIRDNLRIGRRGATEGDMLDVLERVNLAEIVDRADDGLDTQVGEGGVKLSGGQRQRLAIARALLAAPPILLLDESTSSLDSLNEMRMKEAIDAVAVGRTMLVIAHRLSTVVDSDAIIVLDEGQVCAVGSHDELLETSALYRSIASHQLLTN